MKTKQKQSEKLVYYFRKWELTHNRDNYGRYDAFKAGYEQAQKDAGEREAKLVGVLEKIENGGVGRLNKSTQERYAACMRLADEALKQYRKRHLAAQILGMQEVMRPMLTGVSYNETQLKAENEKLRAAARGLVEALEFIQLQNKKIEEDTHGPDDMKYWKAQELKSRFKAFYALKEYREAVK